MGNHASGTESQFVKRSRRAFLSFSGAIIASVLGWEWIWSRPMEDGLPRPFRRVLDCNGSLASRLLFDDQHLSPQFSAGSIESLRPNGDIGLDDDLDDSNWKIAVRPDDFAPSFQITLDDIRAVPKTEHITEFKCIEGWSTITRWGGARFRDFVSRYSPGSNHAKFVGLVTPNQDYFVGIDMASMMHPQTLLCYEMNGQPLREEHGAPLRLVIPVKYGIKSIKRIATISFTQSRPPDYWANNGYDYYAGL